MPRVAEPPVGQSNPFIIAQPAEREAYCDRTRETDRVVGTLRDPRGRLLLYGDRRLGKSTTIQVAASQVRAEGVPVVVVDLASASTAPAAAQRILTAVHREIGTRWRDVAARLLARMRPGTVSLTTSADAAGQPSVGFQVSPMVEARDALVVTDVLDAIEAELDARGLTIGLALDEF